MRLVLALLGAFAFVVSCKAKPPKPGDKCKTDGVGECPDAKHFMVCRAGTWRLDNCLGENGCATIGTSVRCDQSVANVGDACATSGGAACSADAKQFLKCDGAKMIVDAACRGPKACAKNGTQIACDESAGELGDPCSDEGKATCSVDHKSFLKCAAKTLVVGSTCGGPKACWVDGATVHCDESVGDDGDVCSDPAGHACSRDKKRALECKGGTLKTQKTCKKGCEIKNDAVYCN